MENDEIIIKSYIVNLIVNQSDSKTIQSPPTFSYSSTSTETTYWGVSGGQGGILGANLLIRREEI